MHSLPRYTAPYLFLIFVVTASGCTAIMKPARDAANPPGTLSSDGKIEPCHGYATKPQDCGNAIFNGSRITKVNIGQSLRDVREIMQHDPEGRDVRTSDGQSIEVWRYLTNYSQSTSSVITFTNGKVSSIEQKRR